MSMSKCLSVDRDLGLKGEVCSMGGEVCRRNVHICFLSAKVVQCLSARNAFMHYRSSENFSVVCLPVSPNGRNILRSPRHPWTLPGAQICQ